MDVPGADACLIHIVQQGKIDENGDEAIKFRPCHDLSYNLRHVQNLSINDHHIAEEVHAIQCAFAFWRVVRCMVFLRRKYPNTTMLF